MIKCEGWPTCNYRYYHCDKKKGDIILANGRPRCVVEAQEDKITVINYEDSSIEQLLPERYLFMGNTYFYGKIVSMFGQNLKNKNGSEKMLKYMMLSEMMKGQGNNSQAFGGMNGLLVLMFLGKNSEGIFDGLYDGIFDNDEAEGDD
ncbi:MAG: hypothetical protein IJJ74_11965 [Eubacterium sp.]|nr:hypothetical protein [Eubacterium sp.]